MPIYTNKFLLNLVNDNKNILLKDLLENEYKIKVIIRHRNSITYKKGNKAVSFNYDPILTNNKYIIIIC